MFEEGLAAISELLGGGADHAEMRLEVHLSAPDLPALLADWIAELAYLAESEAFVPKRAERLDLDGCSLSATVAGYRGEPPHLVKAVTYHRLEFERAGDGWRARVVLDV